MFLSITFVFDRLFRLVLMMDKYTIIDRLLIAFKLDSYSIVIVLLLLLLLVALSLTQERSL